MPGDVVLGTPSGLLFIPPQWAEACCEPSERTRLRDRFGFQRIREGKYTAEQIDRRWAPDIEEDCHRWRLTNTPDDLKSLKWDWSQRLARRRKACSWGRTCRYHQRVAPNMWVNNFVVAPVGEANQTGLQPVKSLRSGSQIRERV